MHTMSVMNSEFYNLFDCQTSFEKLISLKTNITIGLAFVVYVGVYVTNTFIVIS